MKKIAVIGSSGGHLFVLGGQDAQGLLDEIARQAGAAGFEVSHVAFVAASSSMDHITDTKVSGPEIRFPLKKPTNRPKPNPPALPGPSGPVRWMRW